MNQAEKGASQASLKEMTWLSTMGKLSVSLVHQTSVKDSRWQRWHRQTMDSAGHRLPGTFSYRRICSVIDDFWHFPEFAITNSISVQSAFRKLEHISATHGVPDKLQTDNYPPFSNQEFKDLPNTLGLHIGKWLHIGLMPTVSWKTWKVHDYLVNYRATRQPWYLWFSYCSRAYLSRVTDPRSLYSLQF